MSDMLDVIIVGAGSAGLAALREVRKNTDKFLIINDGPLGTTCARTGCMPSKALIEAANAFHKRHSFNAFGISGGDTLKIDIPAVLNRVRTLRDFFVSSTLGATDDLGEKHIAGQARLTGPNSLEVNGQHYEAHKIILAPGSSPYIPADWNLPEDRLLTSDNLFEQTDLPPRIAVIGLGAIGLELAQALSRLGIEVHAFGSKPLLGGLSDPKINADLRELLEQEFPIITGEKLNFSAGDNGVTISWGDESVQVDKVVAATGRRPNVRDLGLDTLGITLDQKGLPSVNPETLQVADLPIYLTGDANGERALLHEASDEGHIAGINASSSNGITFKRRVPLSIVFSDPNIAVVGKAMAKLDASTMVPGSVDYSKQGRARTADRNRGRLTVYADSHNGLLLGAEMCAPSGEHLAHLIALAIERRLTAHDLLRLPFYHPTLEEGLRTALREIVGQVPHGEISDLADCSGLDIPALE